MMAIHIHPILQHRITVNPIRVEKPPQHVHVPGARIVAVGADPVFRARVLVAQRRERDARDRVRGRGHAVAFTAACAGLLGQEAHGGGVADAGGAVGVEFYVVGPPGALGADVAGGEGRDGAAEGVPHDGDAVGWVFGVEVFEEVQDGLALALPGFPEAVVRGAAGAEVGDGDLVHFEVFGPVLLGLGAAEGEDGELGGLGGGDETWWVLLVIGWSFGLGFSRSF